MPLFFAMRKLFIVILLLIVPELSWSACIPGNACFVYVLDPYVINTAFTNPAEETTYLPTNDCSSGSVGNGTLNTSTQIIPNVVNLQKAHIIVYQAQGGLWQKVYEQSLAYIYIPTGYSFPYIPPAWGPSWKTPTEFAAMVADGYHCSMPICPNPTAEAAFLATCPLSQGTYNCEEPLASVCSLHTCDDVANYVGSNQSVYCPGITEPKIQYTCSEGSPPSVSEIQCSDCSLEKQQWAQQNCSGIEYLKSYDCATGTGICYTCEENRVNFGNAICGGEVNVETYDCNTHQGTCKDCETKRAYYGYQNCGNPGWAKTINCDLNQFACFTCDEKANFESDQHCHGPLNYKSYDCETGNIQCDCTKMAQQWGQDNCGGSQYVLTFNCETYTGQCKDGVSQSCDDLTNECVNQCKSLNNIAAFGCSGGEISIPCVCKDNSVTINDGAPGNPASTGGITPSPSSASQQTNTSDKNQAQVADNTDAINKTMASGFNTLHSDVSAQTSLVDKISSKMSSFKDDFNSLFFPPSNNDSPSYDSSVPASEDVSLQSTFTQFTTLFTGSSIFSTSKLVIENEKSWFGGEIKGKMIKFDFAPFAEQLNYLGNIFYLMACITAIFIVFA